MVKMTVFAMLLMACTAYGSADLSDLNDATVMITDRGERGGGTGVILKSRDDKSLILTNGHVCDVAEKGGLVHTGKRKVAVENYTKSDQHDLCIVEVMGNLGINTSVAKYAPKLMDKVYVSGHPFLFPTTVTEGHLSNSMIIQIVLGIRKCTKEDVAKNPIACIFFGGIPMVRELNTNVISNLIAPGNSGSGVYNSSGELIGLIFAGAGRGMSPGIIVPYEYLRSFLDNELKSGKLKTNVVAKARGADELAGDEESESKLVTTGTASLTTLTNLNNLVFIAIKDTRLDRIENKVKECVNSKEIECLTLLNR